MIEIAYYSIPIFVLSFVTTVVLDLAWVWRYIQGHGRDRSWGAEVVSCVISMFSNLRKVIVIANRERHYPWFVKAYIVSVPVTVISFILVLLPIVTRRN